MNYIEAEAGDVLVAKKNFGSITVNPQDSFLIGDHILVLGIVKRDRWSRGQHCYKIQYPSGTTSDNWNLPENYFELLPRLTEEELQKAKSFPPVEELGKFLNL